MGFFSGSKEVLEKKPLTYVRSRDLTIFSFFDIDPQDVADYLDCIDVIDPQFTRVVNLKAFLKTYCPTPRCKYVFKLLWKEYTELILRREKEHIEKTPIMADLLSDAKNTIDNLTFACYVLLLMTLEKDEISGYIFWLYFRSKGDKKEFEVSQQKLIELANVLGKSKKEHEKKALKRRIKALEKLTKSVDPAYFKRGKFHLLDLKCGQPFTKALIDIQKEIKSRMLSGAAWKRISIRVHAVMRDFLPAKRRMVDPKNTLTYTHYKNTGDRKRARKELAPYVKLLTEFSTYLTSDDDTLVVQRTSMFSFLFGWMFKSNKKVVPATDTSGTTTMEDRQEDDQIPIPKEKPKIDHLDLSAMTYRYRRQMRLPIKDVYDTADQRREIAEELILRCEEDVLSGDEIAAKFAAEKHDNKSDDESLGEDVDDDELNAMMEQFDVKLDENGEVVLDEDGEPVLIKKEPSEGDDGGDYENGEENIEIGVKASEEDINEDAAVVNGEENGASVHRQDDAAFTETSDQGDRLRE